jgi:hypothetical protein
MRLISSAACESLVQFCRFKNANRRLLAPVPDKFYLPKAKNIKMNDNGHVFRQTEIAEIEEFKATHQGMAERIQKAVVQLKKVEGINDAYESFNKLRNALTRN